MPPQNLTSGDLEALGDAVFELFGDRQLEQAKLLLERIFAVGYAPEVLLMAYAVCLSELGDDARASKVFALAQQVAPTSELADKVSNWLPGGRDSRGARQALKDEAERWLPRSGQEGEPA